MRLEDVKDRIDNFFDQITGEELFDILTEEFGFPVEYSNDGLFEVASSEPLTRQYELDRDEMGTSSIFPQAKPGTSFAMMYIALRGARTPLLKETITTQLPLHLKQYMNIQLRKWKVEKVGLTTL